MNAAHIVATGGLTGLLAQALQYLTHWPLQPLTDVQATSFAGLLVASAGAILAYWQSRQPKGV